LCLSSRTYDIWRFRYSNGSLTDGYSVYTSEELLNPILILLKDSGVWSLPSTSPVFLVSEPAQPLQECGTAHLISLETLQLLYSCSVAKEPLLFSAGHKTLTQPWLPAIGRYTYPSRGAEKKCTYSYFVTFHPFLLFIHLLRRTITAAFESYGRQIY
jgi:hypothetical protein